MLLLYSPGGFDQYFEERHREELADGGGAGDALRRPLATLGYASPITRTATKVVRR